MINEINKPDILRNCKICLSSDVAIWHCWEIEERLCQCSSTPLPASLSSET